ncbi:MAG: OadG family protein [Anaerolineales bacterium]
MAENLLIALQITLLGMGLVFGLIILLWGLMAALTALTRDQAEPTPQPEPDAPQPASAPPAADKARAAAVAVAVALAQQSLSTAHPLSAPPTAIVSAWQLGMRTRQMTQKGNTRR